MTKFQKDLQAAINGDYEVIKNRRNDLRSIDSEGRKCKNAFRLECLLQEYARLKRELAAIEDAAC